MEPNQYYIMVKGPSGELTPAEKRILKGSFSLNCIDWDQCGKIVWRRNKPFTEIQRIEKLVLVEENLPKRASSFQADCLSKVLIVRGAVASRLQVKGAVFCEPKDLVWGDEKKTDPIPAALTTAARSAGKQAASGLKVTDLPTGRQELKECAEDCWHQGWSDQMDCPSEHLDVLSEVFSKSFVAEARKRCKA